MYQITTGSDSVTTDEFGISVSVSGNSVIVGAPLDDDNGMPNSGSAYIYVYNQSTQVWDETKITASNPGTGSDLFGESVSISGTSAIVGARQADRGAFSNNGAAYIFVYDINTNTWDEYELIASNKASHDQFGMSVSISGTSAIVGASKVGAEIGAAYIYVYDKSNNNWKETIVTASDGADSDHFGKSVSISGMTAVVGASGNDDTYNATGSAYVYKFNLNTGVWDETKIVATDPAANALFGESVSISGAVIAVGAYGFNYLGLNSYAGAVYVYTLDITNNVWEGVKIMASTPASGDYFGKSVSIWGSTLVVAAKGDDESVADSGAIYIYQRNVGGNWLETKLKAPTPAGSSNFGGSVSVSGPTVVVGVSEDDSASFDQGSVYIFDQDF